MYKFILYDTSNYVDFPIGGQLTSVRNFLYYMIKKHRSECDQILLVGVTNNIEEVGKKQYVCIEDTKFDFIPVLWRESNLDNVKKSLRLQFLKGLFLHGRKILCDKHTVHYFHTPEAYIYTKLVHPCAITAVFSHGSFFNMVTGFRFFKNNKVIGICFNLFIKLLLKSANVIFALDDDSRIAYEACGAYVKMVDNSIILPEKEYKRVKTHSPLKLLFVGRLSKIKQVDVIIKAIEMYEENCILTIVGDGEEKKVLHDLVEEKNIQEKIQFVGKVEPEKVKEFMIDNDVLIMNSILEGKPMSIIEALSYGLPIITTPVGGIPNLVEEHKNAIYTDGTEKGIVNALKIIREQYKELSNNAIVGSKKYDYLKVNEDIYKILSRL